MTICNEEHQFFVPEQLRKVNALGDIILEPVVRNTAPVIALAASAALAKRKPIRCYWYWLHINELPIKELLTRR